MVVGCIIVRPHLPKCTSTVAHTFASPNRHMTSTGTYELPKRYEELVVSYVGPVLEALE